MRETKQTLCNRDCPDTCSIIATLEDGRITRLQGDKEHPVTKGFLCYRTNQFLTRQYSPERLKTPLIRRGDSLQEASWEEAIDVIAKKLSTFLSESGPASIFHYRSGGSLGMLKLLGDYFFEKLGPTTTKRGDICSGGGDAAQLTDFGDEESSDIFTLLHAKNILIWGKNVYTSSPHTLSLLKDAQARGVKMVLIDPVWHRTANLCEAFYQPKPGGDFSLAMAVARILFERGWVSKDAADYCDHLEELRALAFAQSVEDFCREAEVPIDAAFDLAQRLGLGKPTAILVGWGMARRSGGAATVRALDALCAISGNLGIEGGGVSYYYKRRGAFDCSWITGSAPRTICEPLFGKEILSAKEPPIRAVWVTAGNPVAMLPESKTTIEALQTRELVVVVDSFLTDTAKLAHVVLPTTTLLEDDDLLGSYGHHWIGASRPVVAPPGGVKSDFEILQLLGDRVGRPDILPGDVNDWKNRFIGAPLREKGVTLEKLSQGYVKNPLAPKVVFSEKKFLTPSGKVNLITKAPEKEAAPNAEFPLLLMALSTEKSQSSQWATSQEGYAEVYVHPEASSGVSSGGLARLQSTIGELSVVVRHDPRQRRDVALMAKGGHFFSGRCANALIQAKLTDAGEGGALYEERVRLIPA